MSAHPILEGAEEYRDSLVEFYIWPKGVPYGCAGGYIVTQNSKRRIRWSAIVAKGGYAEIYMSVNGKARAWNSEVQEVMETFGISQLLEMNTTDDGKDYLRCFVFERMQ